MEEEALDLVSSVISVDENVDFLAAYGSGAKKQKPGVDPRENMLDFIISVSDSERFHRENLRKNRRHYSFLGYLGVKNVARIQRDFAAKAYFNTLVRVPPTNRLIKYGVIETTDLVTDLLDWDNLYMSGRLQKPVMILKRSPKETSSDERRVQDLRLAMNVNQKSAVYASLLSLPERFSETNLYQTICGLSYHGDFRTTVGEDKQKIANIATGSHEELKQLYLPIIEEIETVQISGSSLVQDLSPASVHNHLELVPKQVLWKIQERIGSKNQDLEETIFSLAHRHDYSTVVNQAISSIVWSSSLRQSLKNSFTAGAFKTIVYSSKKLVKMLRSLR